MTKIESTPGSATLVAVDIAKKYNEVLIERRRRRADGAFGSRTKRRSTSV